MSPSSVDSHKRVLRSQMRARVRPAADDVARASRAATEAVVVRPEFQSAERVGLYASLPDEFPTDELIEAVLRAGKILLLPRCVGDDLEFARVEGLDSLRRGGFGTLEPSLGIPSVRLGPGDLVLLPGLAFDRRGGRLGRGRGFYDRAFARADVPFLCGLAYAAQLVARVPLSELDVQMNAVATEDGWVAVDGPPAIQRSEA